MAQFIFHLEGVLRHRKNIEHEKQRELAVVQAKMTALELQLRALDAEVKSSNDDVRQNQLTGRLDLSFLAAHRRYLASTQRRAIELAQQMAVVQRQLDLARQAVASAARDRKVLEKLRENQHAVWRDELKRKELAEQDEAAMQMSYRKTLT
jgi:flagellar export protein FliJ